MFKVKMDVISVDDTELGSISLDANDDRVLVDMTDNEGSLSGQFKSGDEGKEVAILVVKAMNEIRRLLITQNSNKILH